MYHTNIDSQALSNTAKAGRTKTDSLTKIRKIKQKYAHTNKRAIAQMRRQIKQEQSR